MISRKNKFAVQLKMEPLIRNISDTARWVTAFRADESERPDAVFHDPFARRLTGDRDQQIANTIQFTKNNGWTFVAKTFLFDQVVLQHVAQGYDMIINLAAGLLSHGACLHAPWLFNTNDRRCNAEQHKVN